MQTSPFFLQRIFLSVTSYALPPFANFRNVLENNKEEKKKKKKETFEQGVTLSPGGRIAKKTPPPMTFADNQGPHFEGPL